MATHFAALQISTTSENIRAVCTPGRFRLILNHPQEYTEELPANSPSKCSLSPALQLMHRVLEKCRVTFQGLRSCAIASATLEQALADCRNDFPITNAQFRILVTGHPIALNSTTQEQIYLIAREALANAFHHSNATNIEVEIEYLSENLRVVIRDDGCGMGPEAVRLRQHSPWGLPGMQAHARSIGACLRIWSRRGLGTEVEVSISSELAAEARTCPRA